MECTISPHIRVPWNKGKLVGQKAPFKPKEVWAIRARLQIENRARELALFDPGIDSKLPACDLVKLRVRDVCHGDRVAGRAGPSCNRRRNGRSSSRSCRVPGRRWRGWVRKAGLRPDDYLFPSRVRRSPHLGTRQYARILDGWVSLVGLDPAGYGTHSMRRTKASLIYRRTKNLRAVQLLLGHAKLESTVRYLGIEVDDALELAEQTDV
jgi:integrase